jgi:hypothetical protein
LEQLDEMTAPTSYVFDEHDAELRTRDHHVAEGRREDRVANDAFPQIDETRLEPLAGRRHTTLVCRPLAKSRRFRLDAPVRFEQRAAIAAFRDVCLHPALRLVVGFAGGNRRDVRFDPCTNDGLHGASF